MEKLMIGGRTCHILRQGEEGPVIYWPFKEHHANQLDIVENKVKELIKGQSFLLMIFQVEDWDRDLSPWFSHGPFAGSDFSGGGAVTLKWLMEEGVTYVKSNYSQYSSESYLAGYSLGGLFALWAFYETGAFKGVAGCSATLWFDGWESFMKEHQAPQNSFVYLSLGGKEAKTKNAVMSTIADCYRRQVEYAAKDRRVVKHVFEQNPGGHFSDTEARVVKGIRWLLEQHRSCKAL